MSGKEIWLSQREKKWVITNGRFSWTDEIDIWDWDSCTVCITRSIKDELLAVVRSKTNKNSSYMGNKPVELRFMLGFPINTVHPPVVETYTARKNISGKTEGPKERWVLQINDDHWLWEWAHEGEDINSSYIYQLYRSIEDELSSQSIKSDNIFDIEDDGIKSCEDIIPVIYQPAVDSLKNFVREVHCAKKPIGDDGTYEIEVTIIFSDEILRDHSRFDPAYRIVRYIRYGRVFDIETLRIMVKKNKEGNTFTFKDIYSGKSQLNEDSIHEDKEPPPAPERKIKYFFMDHNHPVIFINTSNHAMAEHDTNHRLWKWEYIPWLSTAPIIPGSKTREEIDKEFKPIIRF